MTGGRRGHVAGFEELALRVRSGVLGGVGARFALRGNAVEEAVPQCWARSAGRGVVNTLGSSVKGVAPLQKPVAMRGTGARL